MTPIPQPLQKKLSLNAKPTDKILTSKLLSIEQISPETMMKKFPTKNMQFQVITSLKIMKKPA